MNGLNDGRSIQVHFADAHAPYGRPRAGARRGRRADGPLTAGWKMSDFISQILRKNPEGGLGVMVFVRMCTPTAFCRSPAKAGEVARPWSWWCRDGVGE